MVVTFTHDHFLPVATSNSSSKAGVVVLTLTRVIKSVVTGQARKKASKKLIQKRTCAYEYTSLV